MTHPYTLSSPILTVYTLFINYLPSDSSPMIKDTGMNETQYITAVTEALHLMNSEGGPSDGTTLRENQQENHQKTHQNTQQKTQKRQHESQETTGRLHKVVYAARKTVTLQCVVQDPAAILLAVALANRADEGKRYTLFFAPNGYDDEVSHILS